MATLRAEVNGQEVTTVVSTPDLGVTTGNVTCKQIILCNMYRCIVFRFTLLSLLVQLLHRLAAKAVISDWEDGMLSENKTRHEVCVLTFS